MTFEELAADATEDELAAEQAVAKTTVRGFTRKRGERQTFPEHLPRERVVIDPPTACECCGSNRLRKLGEDVTRTLEVVPGRDGPGEVLLPRLREGQPGPCAVPCRRTRMGRPEPVGHDHVREVRPASALKPPS